eukprot:scaffold172918_cov31-Tisochrysis_lutea.AAC.6
MGEPHVYDETSPQPSPSELRTPLKWGNAYDGPADLAYPLPQEPGIYAKGHAQNTRRHRRKTTYQ